MHIEKNNIFLVGPLGAGKTTVGKMLADELGMEFYDTDCEIEKRTGVDLAWIFDLEGEEKFRQRESSVIEDLSQKNGIVLATGGGSVLSPESRKFLSARGFVIFLRASITQQMIRTEHESSRRPMLLDTDESKEDVLKEMKNSREPLYEEVSDMTFDMDGIAVSTAVKQIVKLLRSV